MPPVFVLHWPDGRQRGLLQISVVLRDNNYLGAVENAFRVSTDDSELRFRRGSARRDALVAVGVAVHRHSAARYLWES